MSGHQQMKKYILRKVMSKKCLNEEPSTPRSSRTDQQHTSSSSLKGSDPALEQRVQELQLSNQNLKSQLHRMRFVEEELAQCRRGFEQLEIEKDFYMRAYKTLKKQSDDLFKQTASRRRQLASFRTPKDGGDARHNIQEAPPRPRIPSRHRGTGDGRQAETSRRKEHYSPVDSQYQPSAALNRVRSSYELSPLNYLQELQQRLQGRGQTDREHPLQRIGTEANPYGFISKSKANCEANSRF